MLINGKCNCVTVSLRQCKKANATVQLRNCVSILLMTLCSCVAVSLRQ